MSFFSDYRKALADRTVEVRYHRVSIERQRPISPALVMALRNHKQAPTASRAPWA